MKKKVYLVIFIIIFLSLIGGVIFLGKGNILLVATTTSLADSHLLDLLAKKFQEKEDISVKILGVGSGYAFLLAKQGNVDLIITHSPEDEDKFIKEGFGRRKYKFLKNYFLILGPKEDVASIEGTTPYQALKNIYLHKAKFVSRGDASGTHKKELFLWNKIDINPRADKNNNNWYNKYNNWYIETGQGMGNSLLIASQMQAYTICDVATFTTFKHKIKLDILINGRDIEDLANVYNIIELNPQKIKNINYKDAVKFKDFLLSESSRKLVEEKGGFFEYVTQDLRT